MHSMHLVTFHFFFKKNQQNALINIQYYDHVTCIVTNIFVVKSTRCTNFTNLFCHETLHISDSSSVQHQQFIHCTLSNGIRHTGL